MTAQVRDAAPSPWQSWQVRLDESSDGRPICLSLCNTRHFRNSSAPRETLNAYEDLAKWAVVKHIFSQAEGAQIVNDAAMDSHVATVELRRAIRLREAVAGTFAARARGTTEAAADLAIVMESFNEAAAHVKLALAHGRLMPCVPPNAGGLRLPRWQAAFSAIGLLTSESIARVKECADDRGCGWLFLDAMRNGCQFCFSNECGNRSRQAKFRERRRQNVR